MSEGGLVQLNGSASTDPEGDRLTYAWNQTAGPSVELGNASSANMSFTAPDVGAAGDTLTFEMTVTDNDGANSTDTVDITVNNVAVNQPPEANAGNNQTVNEGNNVTLDSSGTDPEGDTLTYAWNQTAGPSVTLSAANSPTPTFVAPDVGAAGDTLTFELTVNDGNGNTATDTVNVNVSADGALVNQNDLVNYIFQSGLPALFYHCSFSSHNYSLSFGYNTSLLEKANP